MTARRGEVVLLDFPYTSGGSKVRPALVVQADEQNRKLANTIVAMISSNLRHATEPTNLFLELGSVDGMQSGLRQDSTVNCTRLFTIEQTQVLRTLVTLSPPTMQKINVCLCKAMDL